jgi:hypothetical protein
MYAPSKTESPYQQDDLHQNLQKEDKSGKTKTMQNSQNERISHNQDKIT